MEGYGRLWKLELNPTDDILSLLNASFTEYCFNFGKCNERTNKRTNVQKYLCTTKNVNSAKKLISRFYPHCLILYRTAKMNLSEQITDDIRTKYVMNFLATVHIVNTRTINRRPLRGIVKSFALRSKPLKFQ